MVFQDAGTTRIVMPGAGILLKDSIRREKTSGDDKPFNMHAGSEVSYGVVYANALAAKEIEKPEPQFPPGAIIVREKRASEAIETPEVVIAMIKRERNFSKKTDDWEFFVFGGADLKLEKRETKGSCAECHKRTEKTDWVFRDYLKDAASQ